MEEISNNVKTLNFSFASPSVKPIQSDLKDVSNKVEVKQKIEEPKIKEPKKEEANETFQLKFGSADSPGIKFQVISKESGEIIREFPFKSALDVSKDLNKSGLLVDTSA